MNMDSDKKSNNVMNSDNQIKQKYVRVIFKIEEFYYNIFVMKNEISRWFITWNFRGEFATIEFDSYKIKLVPTINELSAKDVGIILFIQYMNINNKRSDIYVTTYFEMDYMWLNTLDIIMFFVL